MTLKMPTLKAYRSQKLQVVFDFRRWVTRIGMGSSIVLIMLVSTLSSILLTLLVAWVVGDFNSSALLHLMLYTVPLPLLISGPVAWPFMHILFQLDSLENEMRQLASIDSLTGLLNRRLFLSQAQQYAQFAKRELVPFSVILMDLDDFKLINDTFGHDCGDLVLKSIGETINSTLRESDFAGRYGGEEFVFLLPNTKKDAAKHFIDRLQRRIHKSPVYFDGAEVEVTASIGVVDYIPGLNSDLRTLLHLADQAMYKAKRTGKNRVSFSHCS